MFTYFYSQYFQQIKSDAKVKLGQMASSKSAESLIFMD